MTAGRARSLGLVDPVEPCHARLGAMVQALVVSLSARSAVLDLGGTPLLIQGRLVMVGNDEPVSLTDRERAVLETLTRRPGVVVSKRALLNEVWTGESDDHVVEVTVGRLRRRFGPAGAHIETVMRRGYRLSTTLNRAPSDSLASVGARVAITDGSGPHSRPRPPCAHRGPHVTPSTRTGKPHPRQFHP